MSLELKLKPDRSITGLIIPLTMLPIFGVVTLIFDIFVGMRVMAGMVWMFAIFYLFVFLRTKDYHQLFLFLWATFLGVMIYINWTRRPDYELIYFLGLIFFGVLIFYFLITRRLKWRGREIFELAAENVEAGKNGYTSRPRPVGRVEYSAHQLHDFAAFTARHLIALPYGSSQSITLVPVKMGDEYGRLLGLSGDYRDASWINFDLNGEVSVRISQKDYLDYREPLAFDELCTSFGQVFIDFLDLHAKGEGVRILDRLDDLKLGVFS